MIAQITFIDNSGSNIELVTDDVSQLVTDEKSIMSIDGSTDITGVSIIGEASNRVIATVAFKRKDETAVAYKVRLKKAIETILRNNKHIKNIFYEEPFIGYANAAKNLLMLRTSIEELKIENEPELDYIDYIEVNNKKWKKLWLHPEKCPNNSEAEKKVVKDKLVGLMPVFDKLTQDEIDATAMGLVANEKLNKGSENSLKSKKATRAFQFNTYFIATSEEDMVLSELMEIKEIPSKVLENGVCIVELNSKEKFENAIMDKMGDDDKLLMIRFNAKHHGNILLKYNIGYLSDFNDTIYGLVWRKTRKK